MKETVFFITLIAWLIATFIGMKRIDKAGTNWGVIICLLGAPVLCLLGYLLEIPLFR